MVELVKATNEVGLQFASLTSQRKQWHPTPVLLPGKSHGWRSLVGCSPWGHEESDTTEQLHFHFSFSCIGEGNGNPLQSSCLENPRDGRAWWAAVYGVALALSSRAVAAMSRFPSRGSRDLCLSLEAFPRGFTTGLSHVPPLCESTLGLKVEAVQGKKVSLEWTETSRGLWE